jgi:hypothetical protein
MDLGGRSFRSRAAPYPPWRGRPGRRQVLRIHPTTAPASISIVAFSRRKVVRGVLRRATTCERWHPPRTVFRADRRRHVSRLQEQGMFDVGTPQSFLSLRLLGQVDGSAPRKDRPHRDFSSDVPAPTSFWRAFVRSLARRRGGHRLPHRSRRPHKQIERRLRQKFTVLETSPYPRGIEGRNGHALLVLRGARAARDAVAPPRQEEARLFVPASILEVLGLRTRMGGRSNARSEPREFVARYTHSHRSVG